MATTSFIKIYGPPVLKAIKELEKIAFDMPEVCIMDTMISQDTPLFESGERSSLSIQEYFSDVGEVTIERCDNIISKSGERLGEYDFFFEWFTEPNFEQLKDLIQKIDEALAPLGCKYTITTEK
jgi:hypothetical protein